jgi:D-alanyl-D-alanine-carboxypeptidase/D-alanyl-D-alanine-endopeptidase
MNHRFLLPAIAFFLLHAAPGRAALTDADIQRTLAPRFQAGLLQAVSVGVVQPAGTLLVHGGTLAPDLSAAPSDRTLYEIGSISKVFTGLLLADAVVRGEVTLDTPLSTLLPPDVALPDGAGDRITLRMLSTHTSGLPRIPVEIPTDDYRDPYSQYGEPELWATLRRVKLDFPPGEKASYSNLAAGLLGTLLARRAGVSFEALLSERITRPLGLVDTGVAVPEVDRARRAPPFTSAGQPWTPWDFKALASAGGIRSSLADMVRFATAMLHPKGHPLEAAMELAWAKQDLKQSLTPGGQGLGWMVAGDGRTRWHNGMTGGFHAALFVNRELGIATVLLSNRSHPAGTEIAEELVRRAAGLPERAAPNQDRAEVALTIEQLDRCVGTFRLAPQFALTFERQNLALFLTPTGQPQGRLFSASPDTFFSRRVLADVVFELPADGGPATAVVLKQNGREIRGLRE